MEAVPDDRTLRRIIALLVALAGLAERAAGRSFVVRWFVLSLLRHAEAAALGLVPGEAGAALPDLGQVPRAGCGREDAVLLALRLRLLASMLADLFDPADGRPGRNAARDRVPHSPASRLRPLVAGCGSGPIYPDTS